MALLSVHCLQSLNREQLQFVSAIPLCMLVPVPVSVYVYLCVGVGGREGVMGMWVSMYEFVPVFVSVTLLGCVRVCVCVCVYISA